MFSTEKEKKVKQLEDVRRISKANAFIWESRLSESEKARKELQYAPIQNYVKFWRATITKLSEEKCTVLDLLERNEQDSLEIFGALKVNDEKKDKEVRNFLVFI